MALNIIKPPDGKLLQNALTKHGYKYSKRLKSCRRDVSEESVHRLRTGSRRLLALIELFRELAPQNRLDKLRRHIKMQLDGLDELRDTQVMLQEIGKAAETLPELIPFQRRLLQRERRLLAEVQVFIKKLPAGKLKRKLKRTERRCKRLMAGSDINAAVLTVIDNVYATVLARRSAINPEQLPSLHHFRIAVKKLRYILAAAQPMLPGLPEDHAKKMQNYLTLLGDIQNSAVLFQNLAEFYAAGVPAAVQAHFQHSRQLLLDEFMQRQDEVLGFWRIGRDNGLPWGLDSADWDLG
ncbi:MAG: CHAD domain-containing protein [Methylomonas sp.]